MEVVKALLEQQPLMALFLTIAIGYVVGRDQHQGILARRRRGSVRRARHGLVRAEVGAGADARDLGPRALPLCGGHPVRQAVLHRLDERQRAEGQPDGADRRAARGRREPAVRQDDGSQDRIRARAVRGLGHEHADAAGGDRDARQRRSRGGLLGRLPVRRGRAHPVPVPRLHSPEAQDRRARGRRHGAARDRAAQRRSISASGWAS